ncbi:MAG: competence/damage-inducible protein A [Opitutales bacterium]|nr:competence/damage-inducible protein A [Opitutales bacterium]
MPIKKRLEILSLGDELLLGLRDNAHLSYLGKELARKGLYIARDQEIRDNAEEIQKYFLDAWQRADIVITTGGLGPTADDLTREAIAEALGLKLVSDPDAVASIHSRLADMGRKATEVHLRQAMIPEGAEILPNHNGTAPGVWLEKDGKILIMMPGPGNEMRPMFIEQVLPRLEARDIALINEAYLQLRTCGIPESELEPMLLPLLEPYGQRLKVGYSTNMGIVDLRIGATDDSLSWNDIENLGESCREVLGADFVAYGDSSIAEVVVAHLRSIEKTISVAESCTGGLLSSAFADIPGASKVFRGGIVCYNNEVKQELLDVPMDILEMHGAVSAETAVALAAGVQERLDSDYAISVTGYAGPDNGGPDTAPIGTIYIGYASPAGVWSRKVFLAGNRRHVRERAVIVALDWIRRKLKKYDSLVSAPSQSENVD